MKPCWTVMRMRLHCPLLAGTLQRIFQVSQMSWHFLILSFENLYLQRATCNPDELFCRWFPWYSQTHTVGERQRDADWYPDDNQGVHWVQYRAVRVHSGKPIWSRQENSWLESVMGQFCLCLQARTSASLLYLYLHTYPSIEINLVSVVGWWYSVKLVFVCNSIFTRKMAKP